MTGTSLTKISPSGKTLFLIVLICFLAVLFIRVRLIFTYVPNIGGIEQNVIFSIQTLASGEPLYTDPEKGNYAFTQYSPLYLKIAAFIGQISGLDPEEPIVWHRLSRLLSLLFNLFSIFLAYKTLRFFSSKTKLLPAGLALLLFIFFEQQDYSRPDSLYHLFFALSIYYSFKIIRNEHVLKSVLLTALSLALAIYSKQSAIFLLAPVFLGLLYLPQSRKIFHWFLLSFIIMTLGLKFMILQAPGDILVKNLYLSILNGFDLKWAIRLYFLTAFPRFMMFFLIIALLLVFWKELNNIQTRTISILSLYYLAIAIFSGLKWGSGTNYFFEFCYVTLPGIITLLEHYQNNNPERSFTHKIALAGLLTMVVPQLLIIAWRDFYKSDPASYLQAKETVTLIKNQEWYSEDTRFIIPERKWLANFFFDKTLFAQPDIYRTLWNPNLSESFINPSPHLNPSDIYLIRSKADSLSNHFIIDLQGYTPILKNGPYLVFAPARKE
ncbi:MAG: glycosyltransferase family 39 protein [Bacteroidales bacterium]